MNPNKDFVTIDCVSEKPLLPITENVYMCTYKNLAEVGLKHYDAVLLLERSPDNFENMITLTENFSDKVVTFAPTASAFEKYLKTNSDKFDKVEYIKTGLGNWHVLTRRKLPEDFCNYVVTHKAVELDGLPEGYKIIHAGRALGEDLGYLGDNTGDNISHLNLYLNEITALYWIWRNSSHTVIGLAHYRRFFSEARDRSFAFEKILTKDAALKILESYDIIVANLFFHNITQHEAVIATSGEDLTNLCESLVRKYILQAQPDYLEAFDDALSSMAFFKCNMFITRRNVFDAYCKWLFSFIIDATEEFLRIVDTEKIMLEGKRQRVMGFLCERMLSVWLRKNRLRIKEIKVMKVPQN